MAVITSVLVTRPSLPVAEICSGARPLSAASLRAAGPERSSAGVATGSGFGAGAAGVAAAGFAADFGAAAGTGAALPAPSMVPSTPPTLTLAPSGTRISDSTPAAVAFTSSVTLSVSSSTTGSSTATGSPSFLSHFATVASVTDSPSAGTLISVAMRRLGLWAERLVYEVLLLRQEAAVETGGGRGRTSPADVARAL